MTEVLVIGYGNELRGDDGIGPHVAGELASLRLAGVRTLSAMQLLPEMTAELVDACCAIFVDAQWGGLVPTMTAISPAGAAFGAGHSAAPQGLLALTQAIYGRVPQAWVVAVPAQELPLRESLSTAALANARAACRIIADWIKARPPRAPPEINGPPPRHRGAN